MTMSEVERKVVYLPHARVDMSVVESAVNGDVRAQHQVLEPLYCSVRKHLALQLGFSALVDEAVQESMLTIFRSLGSFRGESALTTWAHKVASRTARRYVRAQKCHQAMLTKDGVMELEGFTPTSLPAESRELIIALLAIKPKKREAFVLLELMGLSAAEAGHVLGTSPNTVSSRYRHARDELRRHFGEGEGQ